jgi:hypothetical protein
MEKIAVKVSTDKDQIVAALFLSPGPIELPLEKHVNALRYEALIMVHTHLLKVDRTRSVSEFAKRLIPSTSFCSLVGLLRLQR